MELFERVLFLEGLLGSKSAIARLLEITPQRLQAYSNTSSQKNLWGILHRLTDKVPNLNRNWLYFEEGPMLSEDSSGTVDLPSASSQGYLDTIRNLTETNRELTETNRRLTEELIRMRNNA